MASSWRRTVTWSLSTASLVVLAVEVLVFLDRGDGQHVYVQRLFHPVLGFVLIGVMALTATVFAARGRETRHGLLAIGSVIAGSALTIAMLLVMLGMLIGSSGLNGVVATSPGFEVVSYRLSSGWLHNHRIVLRLRSRDGLASRESSANLACFIENKRHDSEQSWFFDRAEFAGENMVRV